MELNPQRPLPPVFDEEQQEDKVECAVIWYAYASEAEQGGDVVGARMGYMCAWKEQPQDMKYYQRLINFLHRNGFIDELFKVHEIGVQLHREHVGTLVNFSNLLNEYGFYDRAKSFAEQALTVDSHSIEAWGNLGNAFRGMGDFDNAKSCFEKILHENPEHPNARFNLASVLLAIGDFERGLFYYESRFHLHGYERLYTRNAAPIWNGEDLKGKSIFVYAEQGLGDTFMFSRYIEMLSDLEAENIIFEVQKPVHWIFERIESSNVTVVERQSLDEPSLVQSDYQVPLLSLAQIAIQKRGTLHTDVPYLSLPELNAPRAAEKMLGVKENNRLRVGISWQGNPHAAVDCGRSIELDHWAEVIGKLDFDFVSLQAKDGLNGIENFSQVHSNFHYLEHLDEDCDSRPFEETLKIIEDLDLVITTDTSIAHLAGAMGKPCWVLLQKNPEWRWGLQDSRTHWYPSLLLFRQETEGDWSSVFESVERSLVNIAKPVCLV